MISVSDVMAIEWLSWDVMNMDMCDSVSRGVMNNLTSDYAINVSFGVYM